MGSLCPSRVDANWADNSPYTCKTLDFKTLSSSYSLLPKNKNFFDQVYEVETRKLGFGHYGDVKKCRHKETGVVRAVKIFNKERLGSVSLNNTWFFKQIEILSQISHPLFVKIYEFFEERDRFYLVMDYHSGGDLLQRIRNGKKLRENEIRTIMKQILKAVSYLHNLQIIHRDLKPENILFNEKDNEILIKIIDFDTTTKLNNNGLASGILGTAFYMAPEMVGSEYTEKCDLWSVGIIMYILLTDHLPYSGMSDHQIVNSIQKVNIDFESHRLVSVSEQAKNLLKSLLCKDPRKRISAKDALKHPWLIQEKIEALQTRDTLDQIKQISSSVFTSHDFFISHFSVPQDYYQLDLAFLDLDSDCDGVISSDEIFKFYIENGENAHTAKEKTAELTEKIQGFSEEHFTYSDFIRSGIDLKTVLTQERIRLLLDHDDNKILREDILRSFDNQDDISEWILQVKSKMEETRTGDDQSLVFSKINL